MGKNKRQQLESASSSRKRKPRHNGKLSRPSGISKSQTKSKMHIQAQHSVPTIPFVPGDRILLVGEGDLSFARSLVEHHNCADVTATVYESREELQGKYPYVGNNIAILEEHGVVVRYGVDATKAKGKAGLGGVGLGTIDRVFFNFPHVGGKSTDVNRQVRYNQELLVSFFTSALPSLAPSTSRSTSSIIVTLFEGEPYTLWNIRDLARHSGLQVEKSFKFQAKAYPGYKHARTLGVVKGKNGEAGRGWKGEERAARSFVFVRKGEAPPPGVKGGGNKDESSADEDGMDGQDMEEHNNEEVFEGFDKEYDED